MASTPKSQSQLRRAGSWHRHAKVKVQRWHLRQHACTNDHTPQETLSLSTATWANNIVSASSEAVPLNTARRDKQHAMHMNNEQHNCTAQVDVVVVTSYPHNGYANNRGPVVQGLACSPQ